MAIPSYVGAELAKESNTFEDWFNRTNSITTDLGSRVVHAQANTAGGTTTGNVNIVGIFSANTIAIKDELRGGTVELPDTLLISSNVNMNGGTSLVSNTINHTHQSNTFVLTSNTITASGNTFTINHTNVNVNGTTLTITPTLAYYNATTSNFGGTTLNINVDAFNISSNTTFNANNVSIGNVILTESITLSNTAVFNSEFMSSNANAELTIDASALTISADTTMSGNLTISSSSMDITSAITIQGDTVANGVITAIDFNATSDINLKENIEPISGSLNVLSQMNPVSFNWKETGDKSYGFIAQEIEEILPDIVDEHNGIKSISYIQIISFLVDAVKNQEERIKKLEERL